ncbi:LysR family transcriptional regulator [Pseudoramibacter sp.]|jgi:DNA-binding transcriptional LysR family regulator|uniref:LysR family transcriptional regulator n=1 Tax=Pseudoramibacter sp. TaxID=2034862 RepID=UPI0025ED93FF|nr:LysR family transcriptional regulator [Pseudoramibacter sp.]MCH4072609.1 LysR family transcriptional regulator [Pseudoramibacter sp.]MCH4106380.1 LysR family transcriptional regulator [Pseudoramibacter sp.]
MDLRQLHYFTAVVENGTISEAARKLHLSQPPLSTQIKLLETECGVTLFERGARHITLTEAGRVLYRHAVQILSMAKTTEEEMQNLRYGKQGSVHIGLISSCASPEFFKVIRTFHQHFPGVIFKVTERNTFDLLTLLENGQIELAVIRTPYHSRGLETLTLREDPFAAVFSAEKAPLGETSLAIQQLAQLPLIIYRRWEQEIRLLFQDRDLKPNIVCVNEDARTTLQWASAGLGAALVPRSVAASFPHLTAVSVDAPRLTSKLQLVRRKNAPISQNAFNLFALFEKNIKAKK